jgi:hypothetical protein
MDDDGIVFATTMKVFATTIIYFAMCPYKYRPNMANFVISMYSSMGLVCNYPWVFHDIIFNS